MAKKDKLVLNSNTMVVLCALLIVALASYRIGYGRGEVYGINQGKQAAQNSNQQTDNSINPFKTVSGTVAVVAPQSVTILTGDNQSIPVNVDSETRVTFKTEARMLSDVQSGQKVTIFYQDDNGVRLATRIIIRE